MGSCSTTFNNRMFVFGGAVNKRQISEVAGCGLKHIGQLSFEFHRGVCAELQNFLILCFDVDNIRKCRKTLNVVGNFHEINNSTHPHKYIYMGASEGK